MKKILLVCLILACCLALLPVPVVQAQNNVVHAVLFFSPSCGHCHIVMDEVFPPLVEQYGSQLSIIAIDVTQDAGAQLFMAALGYYNVESSGVPFLAVGERYLIGSIQIPEEFPVLIDSHLSSGGLAWPAIPGLAEAIQAAIPAITVLAGGDAQSEQTTSAPVSAAPVSVWEKFQRDLLGNSLAVLTLLGMLASGVAAARLYPRLPDWTQRWPWLIPLLCVLGLGVAGYLAYVETTHTEAVCGPVGDCNTVQQSEYARLFGVLPVGVLGLLGYVLILLVWLAGRMGGRRSAAQAALVVFGLVSAGLLFSIYLTFLEPFVIGATCAWCLTSALLMLALFWLSLAPARDGWLLLNAKPGRRAKRRL